jgi:ABC-2 type transport system ATP-binding protein
MLSIKNLVVAYGEESVLKGVDLECTRGTIHGLLGRNGAGKTTLFRTIYGFKQQLSGTIIFEGQSLTNRSIAMLETNPFFYSYMKGKEYLDIISAGQAGFQLEKWNAIFDLPLNELIDNYSTGMRKKLAFMGIVTLERPILILDEPFSGIDVESNEKIYQILDRLKKQGKTILLSSHILSSFTGVCDRISVLNQGLIERTFERDDFVELEANLKNEIQQKIKGTLDELFIKE